MTTQEAMLKDQVQAVRSHAGYFLLEDFGLVRVAGADAAPFLQAQTTQDVLALQPGTGQMSALLDRKAHVQAVFSLHRVENDYWILTERSQVPTILARLEFYHFSEHVTFEDLSTDVKAIALQGPAARLTLQSIFPQLSLPKTTLGVYPSDFNSPAVIEKTLTGEAGYILLFTPGMESKLLHPLQQAGIVACSAQAREVLRIEAGLPLFGQEVDTTTMLPATGLERVAVSYTKGCYPGQEVVAKVRTYGAVPFALMGLIFESQTPPQPNQPIYIEGKEIGTLKSTCFSPTMGHVIGLAYLGKEYRVPDKPLTIQLLEGAFQVKVVFLPFYQPMSASAQAKALYEQALQQFSHNEDSKAILALRQAITLDPLLADAYEVLGVILSRQGEYDEAIALMQQLAELDPVAVMPHTNLSVFYMQKGLKEQAEVEKALATTLTFKNALAQKQQAQQAEAEKAQKHAALLEKVQMFEEVLALDEADPLAHFGLGNTLNLLSRFAEAIPHFEAAILQDAKYTVAYLGLGKAYVECAQIEAARKTFEKGIMVASQRGDLMPLQEMQQRLAALMTA